MANDLAVAEGYDRFGPAMSALTENQRKFVLALLDGGDDNWTRAYLEAFPDANQGTARVNGHKLGHDRRILEAMHEEAITRMHAGVIVCVSSLMEIARGGRGAKASEQLKAIGMVLNRVGMNEVTEHRVKVEHSLSDAQMKERIKELANEMGIDPKKLLGNVVDAEFTEVPQEDYTGLEGL